MYIILQLKWSNILNQDKIEEVKLVHQRNKNICVSLYMVEILNKCKYQIKKNFRKNNKIKIKFQMVQDQQ